MRAGIRVPMIVAALAGAQIAVAAPAIPPAAPETSEIVVQGVRDREKQISDFIRQLTPAPSGGQLGRFETSVCPAVAGLPQEQAEFIAQRIRRVAAAAGMPVASGRCDPNVILIVTSNKSALVKRLARNRTDYFPSARNNYDFKSLEDPHSPVAAWQIEGTRGDDGKDLDQDMDGSSVGRSGLYVRKTIEPATRLMPATRQYFAAAVVIVQADALVGLTTTQLADYAAMRAFVRTEPDKLRDLASNTILNVIEAPMGTPIPLTLTPWDLSFLKAYYASQLNNYASRQRSEMKGLMKRNLDTRGSDSHN